MRRQIQKHSILKISDLLNKLMIYQNLYSVSRSNCCQHTTGKHTYFHAHYVNKRDNNKRHKSKFIPTLLQLACMIESASQLPLRIMLVSVLVTKLSSCFKLPTVFDTSSLWQGILLVNSILYKVFSYTVCKILPSEISVLSLWDSNSV